MTSIPATPVDRRHALRADCARCVGLCCVVPAFAASADFALDKPAGRPCPNLLADHRCGIHGELRERGFPGCTAYDCFGAGQHLVQVTFAGREPALAAPMIDAFPVVRELHELLWYLSEARALQAARPLRAEIDAGIDETERLARLPADELAALGLDAHHERVDALLQRVSAVARAGTPARRHRRADLIGRDLRRTDLRGADLRGALLLGADLRGADLDRADLIGADLRGADLRGADLTDSLFLTRFQLGGARGDATTRVPAVLERPAHWAVAPTGARRRRAAGPGVGKRRVG